MRTLFLISFLFSTVISFAQIGDIFIDERRGTVQAMLGNLEIEDYEKEHVGYNQGDSLKLFVFFNERDICTKYYWMAAASEKETILGQFKAKGWQKKSESQWLKENCKTSIKPLNGEKNLIFLVEKSQEELPALAESKKPNKPQKSEGKPKSKKKPKKEKSPTKTKTTTPQQEEKQALTFFGWEIANFDQ